MNPNQISRLIESFARGRGWRKWLVLCVIVVIAYDFSRPILESRLGVKLPSISPGQSDNQRPTPPVLHDDALKEVGRDTFQTQAGLVYGPGSRHGHRIRHVMYHAKDVPGRQGQHGVFDADEQSEVLAIIDDAYEKAKRGEHLSKKTEQNRTIYELDMGRRIGFVGGQRGNQRNRPAARHLRLVLEGNRLITAFPFVP